MIIDKFENEKAFKSFMKSSKLDFGNEVKTTAIAYNENGDEIYDDTVTCFFSY